MIDVCTNSGSPHRCLAIQCLLQPRTSLELFNCAFVGLEIYFIRFIGSWRHGNLAVTSCVRKRRITVTQLQIGSPIRFHYGN